MSGLRHFPGRSFFWKTSFGSFLLWQDFPNAGLLLGLQYLPEVSSTPVSFLFPPEKRMRRWHWLLLYVTMVMVLSSISASPSDVACVTSGGPYIVLDAIPLEEGTDSVTSWRGRNSMSSGKWRRGRRVIKQEQMTNRNDGMNGHNRLKRKMSTNFKYVGEFDVEGWKDKTRREKQRAYAEYVKQNDLWRPIYLGKRCNVCKSAAAPQKITVTLLKSGERDPVPSVEGDPQKNDQLCTAPDEMGRLIAVSQGLKIMTKGIYPVWRDSHGLLKQRIQMLPEWAQKEMGKNEPTRADGLLSVYYLGRSHALCRSSTEHFILYGSNGEEVRLPKINVKVWINHEDLCGYSLWKEVQTVCLTLLRDHRASLCDRDVENVAVDGKVMSMKVFMDTWESGGSETFHTVLNRTAFLKEVEDEENEINKSMMQIQQDADVAAAGDANG